MTFGKNTQNTRKTKVDEKANLREN